METNKFKEKKNGSKNVFCFKNLLIRQTNIWYLWSEGQKSELFRLTVRVKKKNDKEKAFK